MKPDNGQEVDYQQPVAYDTQGRPLYAAPVTPENPAVPQQQIVHVSRAIEPIEQAVSQEVKDRHERSLEDFPTLNLSDHEYIVSAVSRHPIGLVTPIAVTALLIAFILFFTLSFPNLVAGTNFEEAIPYGMVLMFGLLISLLFLIGGYFAISVYLNNRFFLTNESVIQEIQTSLFSKNEQTVSLGNIEDASFSQRGVIQSIFNYGSIRLSTEGDETTYRFDYVANPKRQIAILNNAVEAFKNGRPVEG